MSGKPILVSAHQPNYLPWLGYFHKMTYSDVFVVLDDVQFSRQSYMTRCFVRQGANLARLIVPVSPPRWNAAIRDVVIDTAKFAPKHLETLKQAYGKCPQFDDVIDRLRPAYELGNTSLAEFNFTLIKAIAEALGLTTKFVHLSDLGIKSSGNRLLIDLTLAVGGDIYNSGAGARSYIQGHEYEYVDAGVRLAYQNFVHPEYPQRKASFLAGCSIVDLLFNQTDRATEILKAAADPSFVEWAPER